MKAYKLTDENGQTCGGMQWGENVTHAATGDGEELCSDGWIHVYDNPLLAVLLNPIHANFKNPRLLECECSGDTLDDRGLKRGYKTVTAVREIPLPEITIEHRVRFGILCALEVYAEPSFVVWANAWLDGTNRTDAAASAAAWAAARAALNLIALAEKAVAT